MKAGPAGTLAGLCLALWSCARAPAPVPPPEPAPPPEPLPTEPAPAAPVLDLDAVQVDVLELARLQELETEGWSAGALLARLDGRPTPAAVHAPLDTLAATPAWGAVSALLAQEIESFEQAMQWDVVTDHREAVRWPKSNVSRAFDTRWLRSPRAHWRLAGVVQRIDRRDLHPTPSCGELRFIYRLAYAVPDEQGTLRGSRLPFTLNAVFVPQEQDCAAWARAWAAPPSVETVLDPERLRFDRFEVNAQVLRLPAGVATEPGGQAAYLFAVVELDGGTARLRPLENTPDVARLREDAALRSRLSAWINQHHADIDQGTYLLPEEFLTERALSWSTAGINRVVNRPFSAIYTGAAAAELEAPTGALRHVGDVRGVLDRLDNGSCTGCHQAGSTAGFHLLGPDNPALAGLTNRLAGLISPHLSAERVRRRLQTHALASGAPVDPFRHHSLSPAGAASGPVVVGPDQPCLPEESQEALQPGARWDCAPAHHCEVLVDDAAAALRWGMCVPDTVEQLQASMSCRRQTVRTSVFAGRRQAAPGLPWASHAYTDVFVQQQRFALPEDKRFSSSSLNCRPPVLGVPLGRAFRRCTAEERALEGVFDEEGQLTGTICGVVGGSAFDACVEGDFHGCMEQIVGRGMVASCDAAHPCREDHTCQALPWQLEGVPSEAGQALSEAGVGFCTPTYFLFQLRLDGHPPPT